MNQDKDTLDPVASSETPTNETQVGSQEDTAASSENTGAQAQPEKVYAGKFKSAEELENAYQNAQSKIGQKTYAETIGQKVVAATGRTVKELEEAGYSADEIVQAVIASQSNTEAQPTSVSPLETIKRTVEESRVDKLEWELHLRDFFSETPEAREFRDEIKEFHSMPQYKEMTAEEIFNSKLKKFVSKSEQLVHAKQSEKERASISVTHNTPPEPNPSTQQYERFKKTGHFDDAVNYVATWLGKRK